MSGKVYINGSGSVSAQGTHDPERLFAKPHVYDTDTMLAETPDFRTLIAGSEARRLSKASKMSIAAARSALSEAGVQAVDAIITGTGMGCLRDSEKFLKALIDNDEEHLTPTSFIQSTHNTVAGHLARMLDCKGYNFTYVHGSSSFASTLLDAQLQLQEHQAKNILVGGVDELSDHTTELHRLNGHIKCEKVTSEEVLASTTAGAIFGEGATFFVLSSDKGDQSQAELVAVHSFHRTAVTDLPAVAGAFLERNGTLINDVDLILLGNNGDIDFDDFYLELADGPFSDHAQLSYKHRVGESNSAPAFSMFLATRILKEGRVPEAYVVKGTPGKVKTILLYDQYRGTDHSLVLLRQC